MQGHERPPKANIPLSTETDAAAALRAELELELKNKKQCCYQPYECTQLSLDGFKYCLKHILQDKNAPFRQCQYVYSSNGKSCNLPAPRTDKKDYGYCTEHALKAALARNKQNEKYPPPHTAEVLLKFLSHHVKKTRCQSASSSAQYSEDDRGSADELNDSKITKSQDVFTDLDANQIYNEQCSEVLDYCSDSESDAEAATLTTIWHDGHADSSEDESIDSENEDLLKHANAYTAEEICTITRDKLVRLQSLYVEQYRHLQYLLKEKRRKYLHALKREKETCCNIYSQVRDNPKEQRLYKKLKALNNYHRVHGVDAILSKRLRDLRSKMADGTTTKSHSTSKCVFTEGGVKCGEKPLPLARHCKKHILEDASQVLFKACGKVNGDVECTTPIPGIFEESTCSLHKDIPALRSYSQLRKDSESDMDESGEVRLQYHSHFPENIKTEFMNYDIPPDIPKMETLPSMLFEESSQSMTSNGNEQMDTSIPQDNSEDMEVGVPQVNKIKNEIDVVEECKAEEFEDKLKLVVEDQEGCGNHDVIDEETCVTESVHEEQGTAGYQEETGATESFQDQVDTKEHSADEEETTQGISDEIDTSEGIKDKMYTMQEHKGDLLGEITNKAKDTIKDIQDENVLANLTLSKSGEYDVTDKPAIKEHKIETKQDEEAQREEEAMEYDIPVN